MEIGEKKIVIVPQIGGVRKIDMSYEVKNADASSYFNEIRRLENIYDSDSLSFSLDVYENGKIKENKKNHFLRKDDLREALRREGVKVEEKYWFALVDKDLKDKEITVINVNEKDVDIPLFEDMRKKGFYTPVSQSITEVMDRCAAMLDSFVMEGKILQNDYMEYKGEINAYLDGEIKPVKKERIPHLEAGDVLSAKGNFLYSDVYKETYDEKVCVHKYIDKNKEKYFLLERNRDYFGKGRVSDVYYFKEDISRAQAASFLRKQDKKENMNIEPLSCLKHSVKEKKIDKAKGLYFYMEEARNKKDKISHSCAYLSNINGDGVLVNKVLFNGNGGYGLERGSLKDGKFVYETFRIGKDFNERSAYNFLKQFDENELARKREQTQENKKTDGKRRGR